MLRYLPGQKYDAHHDYFDPELYKGQPDMQRMVEGGETTNAAGLCLLAQLTQLLAFGVAAACRGRVFVVAVFFVRFLSGLKRRNRKPLENGHKMATNCPRTTLSTS